MSKTDNIDDLVGEVIRAIKLAYGRGFHAGGAAMRDTILQAADDLNIPTHDEIAASIRTNGAPKSSWGSVVAAMRMILTKEPNLTVHEIEERGMALYPDINIRSFGNQLRRYEGVKYKRDEETSRWSLIEGVTAGL
ncbi:MAG: hypothetical protein ACRECO_01880 [Xanthobacteraceae bacterium]